MVDLVLLQSISYMAGALGVCVAVIYYVMNLRISQRNQELSLKTQQQTLETRQAQMFMNIYQQTTTKDFTAAWNVFTSQEWKNFNEYRELIQKKEFADPFTILGMYWEGLGVLVREGYLDIRMVALLMCGMTRYFWEKLIPIIDEGRKEMGFRRWYSEAEFLYNELMRYLDEHPELSTELKEWPTNKTQNS